MNIVVFDTETISLNKPFVYNIGYIIVDEEFNTLVKRDYVVEQVWHNLPLFNTAYYAEKRPLYIERMRARLAILEKFGYICQQMKRDFKQYEVVTAYAYNSSFDDGVFEFNCDWFKCNNPFENIPIYDIRGNVHQFIIDKNYIKYCEEHQYFTENGNYSTTAEVVYRYLLHEESFEEEHTALSDSVIETDILFMTIERGAKLHQSYNTRRSIERNIEKELHIKTAEQTEYYFKYNKIRINKDKTEIILK